MSLPYITFDGAEQFAYPKSQQQGESVKYFPMLRDDSRFGLPHSEANAISDDEIDLYDEEAAHPIIEAIKTGGNIESVEVLDDWTDDHCMCCNVVAVVNGAKYGFSAWWLMNGGYKMLVRAESLKKDAIDEFKEYVLSRE